MLSKHRSRVITESRWGDKAMKASLNSNSLQISPTLKAEKEKSDKAKKGNDQKNGNGKKKNGNSNNSGSSDAKKSKKSGIMCSLCGPESTHSDLTCFKSHTTPEALAKIEENKKNPDMKRHFKSLEHAARKRNGSDSNSTTKSP